MNDRLLKLSVAIKNAPEERLRRLCETLLELAYDLDARWASRSHDGYEVGFLGYDDEWVSVHEGTRDFCIGFAHSDENYYKVRSRSGFDIWPEWGANLEDEGP